MRVVGVDCLSRLRVHARDGHHLVGAERRVDMACAPQEVARGRRSEEALLKGGRCVLPPDPALSCFEMLLNKHRLRKVWTTQFKFLQNFYLCYYSRCGRGLRLICANMRYRYLEILSWFEG